MDAVKVIEMGRVSEETKGIAEPVENDTVSPGSLA